MLPLHRSHSDFTTLEERVPECAETCFRALFVSGFPQRKGWAPYGVQPCIMGVLQPLYRQVGLLHGEHGHFCAVEHAVAYRAEHAAQCAQSAAPHNNKVGTVRRGIFRNCFRRRGVGDGFNGNTLVVDAVAKAVEHFLFHAIEGGAHHVFVRLVIEQAPRYSIDGVAFGIVHCADHA